MIEELAALGRLVSAVLGLAIYAFGWMTTYSWIKEINDEEWVRYVSIIWIITHLFLVILWLFWSWLYLI